MAECWRAVRRMLLVSSCLSGSAPDLGFSLNNVVVRNASVEFSTHVSTARPDSAASLYLQDEGILFQFDGDKQATHKALGPCVDGILNLGDIIGVEIMPMREMSKQLQGAVGRDRLRLRRFGNLIGRMSATSAAGYSAQAAIEISMSNITNARQEVVDNNMAVVLQFLCKCSRQAAKEKEKEKAQTIPRTRPKIRRHKPTFSTSEFICLLIPRHQALDLHKYLLTWLRLRSVDWRELLRRLVNKNSTDIALSADMGLVDLPLSAGCTLSDDELTDSVRELLPEQRTLDLPGDSQQQRSAPFVLTREHVNWLFIDQRIPLECQVYPEWVLAYSTDRHGFSLQTLYRRSAYFMAEKAFRCPCLLVVRDAKGNVFGALMSHLPHVSLHAYGVASEIRIFNLTQRRPERKVFKPNEDYQHLLVGNSEMFNIGVDDHGHMGVCIFDGLTSAHLEPCLAFSGLEETNVFGSSENWIDIQNLELWSFRYPYRT